MLKATLKSLLAHKLRLALTALAVVLGVAFMTGTFVLTDTISHTFDALFAQTTSGDTAVVRAVAPYGDSSGGPGGGSGDDRPLTPDTLITTVRAVPGVAAADGSVEGLVTLLGSNGKAMASHAPTIALAWQPDGRLSPLTVASGHAPAGAGQVTIDAATAAKEHFALGDRVTLIANNGPVAYTVVGITHFGSADNLAGATLVSFDLATAQQAVGKPGYVNEIDVGAAPGVATATLLRSIGAVLPQGFEVVTGATVAAEQASSVSQGLGDFNTILLVFGGIALFVGAFLIFNTFSILVGQRTRELALLRAVGASRRQIYASVMGEAFLTGLASSVIGLGAGVGLAAGLYALLSALGIDLPRSTLQFELRTAIVGLVVGTLVTVVSAVLPALRAGRISPAAGLREDAVVAETSLRRRAIIGGAVLAVGVIILAVGLFASAGIGAVGLGAAVTFIGVAMLTPFAVPPMVAVLGRPLPAIAGITGRLGQDNAARNPRRTAATSSALMVGIALVAAIATLGQSATVSFDGLFSKAVRADYILSPQGLTSISPAAEATAASVPGVTAVSGVRMADFHIGRVDETVEGVGAESGPQVLTFNMTQGSTAALAAGDVLVDATDAKSQHYRVGQLLPMGFAATGVAQVTIGGFFKTNDFLGDYVVSNAFLAAHVVQSQDELIALRTLTTSAAMTAALTRALAPYANAQVRTAAQFEQSQRQKLSDILAIVYALLALSIIIALIGVVNTLALSIMERTREIGLLRAVGTQRRQLRAMIRWESVVVSLIGAVLGLVLGLALGSAVVSSLSNSFITTLAIPVKTIIVVLVLAAVFGVGAAVLPARRAARLDVLQAIQAT